jgi:hypothetical protein
LLECSVATLRDDIMRPALIESAIRLTFAELAPAKHGHCANHASPVSKCVASASRRIRPRALASPADSSRRLAK